MLAASLSLLLVALFLPVRDRLGTTTQLGLDGVVTLSATSPGRVLDVLAEPGQHLNADAPMARLTDTVAAAEAERAYADYVALLRQRLAHADAAAADPILAQAWERLQQARSAAMPQLRAPASGRLIELSIVRGQQVAAGASLLQFAPDKSALQLDLELPIRSAQQLRTGSTGSVRLASAPDREYPIRISWVAQTLASDAAGTNANTADMTPHVHARAEFVGAAPSALPGTRADVRIDLGSEPLYRLIYQRWRGV